jgi:hypothetical protein
MAEGLTYVQGEMQASRGEERSSKGTDECPLQAWWWSLQWA